jgi:uncharacterized protein YkwD
MFFRALVLSLAITALHAPSSYAQSARPPASAEANPASDREPGVQHSLSSPLPALTFDAHEDSAAESTLLDLVNQSRREAGVAPLNMEENLRQAARAHARLMVAKQQLEHQFADELPLLQRIAEVSSLRLDRAGENIANATCADGAHQALLLSPPHRKNLLDANFNRAGIAAIWSRGRLYVVQDFAHEVPSYSARAADEIVANSLNQQRRSAGLPQLAEASPSHLDEAACELAQQERPSARLLAATYANRKIITYTQSQPELLPAAASHVVADPNLHQFAIGSCYARNAAYPTGIYWVAILLN